MLDRDPRLIFNMDETSISAKKRFKVLTLQGKIPLCCEQAKFPHLTGCVTIGAAGATFKPLLILPNKATIAGLEQLVDRVHISSTSSGWMNKNIFLLYCILFVADTLLYRLSLPKELRNARILLIVDGHKSRINYKAAILLSYFSIDLLVLPGHCSHLLQPFDVSIASSLKTEFKKETMKIDFEFDSANSYNSARKKKTARDLRTMLIDCFLTAWQKSCTYSNIAAGFESSGISPLNKEIPLNSDYVMKSNLDSENTVQKELYKTRPSIINNRHLNSRCEEIAELYRCETKKEPTEKDLQMNIDDIVSFVKTIKTASLDNGRSLTTIPNLIIEDGNSIIRFGIEGQV